MGILATFVLSLGLFVELTDKGGQTGVRNTDPGLMWSELEPSAARCSIATERL